MDDNLLPLIQGKTLEISDQKLQEMLQEALERQRKLTEQGIPLWMQIIGPPTPSQCKSFISTDIPQLPPDILPKDLFSGWKDEE